MKSFEKYLSKLNPLNAWLWQRPKKNVCPDDMVWYEIHALGHNTLGDMMATISRDAKLSRIYTNHCLKVTPPSLLDSILYETLNENVTTMTEKTLPVMTRQTRSMTAVPILPATSRPAVQIPVANSVLNSSQTTKISTSATQMVVTIPNVLQSSQLPSVLSLTQTTAEKNQNHGVLSSVLNQSSSFTSSNQLPQTVMPTSQSILVSGSEQSRLLNSGIATPSQNQPVQFAVSNQNQVVTVGSFGTAQSLTTVKPISAQPLIVASSLNQALSSIPSNPNGQTLNLNGQFQSSNQNQPLMVVAPNTNKAYALVPIEPQQMMPMVR